MYDTQCERRNLYHLPLAQRIFHSLRPKSLYVFHHIFSFLFGYIVIVVSVFFCCCVNYFDGMEGTD